MVKSMKQIFHSPHHRVEAVRTHRRFVALNFVLFAGIAVVIGMQYSASHAASSTTGQLNGVKIDTSGSGTYGGSTTGPYGSATVHIQGASSQTTTTNPFYFDSLPSSATGQSYTVTVSPTSVGNYVLKGYTYENGSNAGWNPQTSNFHAGSSFTVTIKSGDDYHMRWIYQYVAPPPTPTPTPVPTPTPAPVKTPVPVRTPTPVKTPVPGSSNAAPTPTPSAPDTTPPSAPGGLQALAASGNALVQLTWTASNDNVGVSSYHLERSTDQSTWNVLADQSQLTFQDATAAFGVHYYYRLSAFDAAGNQSQYVTADATTPAFSGSSSTSPQVFSSDDKLAAVSIPSGAFTSDVDCTVITSDTKVIVNAKQGAVAGPYQLICKDSGGDDLATTQAPITWTYALKTKLKGYKNPVGYTIDESGNQTAATKNTYVSKTGGLSFTTASLGTTGVLAAAKPGLPISLIVVVLLVFVIIAGIVIFVLRRSQKQNYDEYLRGKYYDL